MLCARMEIGVRDFTMVQILKHCEENIECVLSLLFLMTILQTPPSELWTSTEDDKHQSFPKYIYIFLSNATTCPFVDFVVLPPGHGRIVTDF